jgi:uncharacterized protein (TIGR03067 family)
VTNLAQHEWGAVAPAIRHLGMACLLLFLQAGCTAPPPAASELHHRLQGYWEGEGPPGAISITIKGNSLHYHARPDSRHEATFTLPAGTDPQQLHATVKDGAGNDEVVYAIVKIEDGTLSLAVDDGSVVAPTTFADAMSRYDLEKAQPREGNAEAHAAEPATGS